MIWIIYQFIIIISTSDIHFQSKSLISYILCRITMFITDQNSCKPSSGRNSMQMKISWVNMIIAQTMLPLFWCDLMFLTRPFSKVCIYVWIYILKVYTTYIKIINHKSYISNNFIICVTIKLFIARALTNIVKGFPYICNTINLFKDSVFFYS